MEMGIDSNLGMGISGKILQICAPLRYFTITD